VGQIHCDSTDSNQLPTVSANGDLPEQLQRLDGNVQIRIQKT
jgi:hypothetical protein